MSDAAGVLLCGSYPLWSGQRSSSSCFHGAGSLRPLVCYSWARDSGKLEGLPLGWLFITELVSDTLRFSGAPSQWTHCSAACRVPPRPCLTAGLVGSFSVSSESASGKPSSFPSSSLPPNPCPSSYCVCIAVHGFACPLKSGSWRACSS